MPPDWEAAVAAVVASGWRRVFALGAPDTGKSTFLRLLAGRLAASGRRVAVVDADIGQKLFGPPAAVTLALVAPDGLWEPRGLAFVGTTDPGKVPRALADAAGAMAARGDALADIVLVNTTGFVAGPGRRLKSWKIAAVAPDALVAIARGDELEPILAGQGGRPVLRLAPSPRARRKSDAQRRRARQAAFRDYFADAARWRMPWPDGPPAATLEGLLCGVVDESGRTLGLARVEAAHAETAEVTLRAPVAPEAARRLAPGRLRLDPEFAEIG